MTTHADAAAEGAIPLRIALVGPVATSIPPPKSGSVESMTWLLSDGLVARGQDVTLFATAESKTNARLHAFSISSTDMKIRMRKPSRNGESII